jgi:hypothetical protein
MKTPKTFGNFMRSYAGIDSGFRERFERAGVSVDTVGRLKAFARERWPDQYGDWRKNTSHFPYGKEQMNKIWSDFLGWCEEDAPAAPSGDAPQEATQTSSNRRKAPDTS